MMTRDDYLAQLQALLPEGAAWSRDPDSELTKLLTVIADELFRIDARIEALVDEADPRTTFELLNEHESVAGLPDTCTAEIDTLEERRAALVAKITGIGDQSRQYFIDIVASLGYEVTITEYKPFFVTSAVNYPLNDERWWFVFQVNAPAETIRPMYVNSEVDHPLREWGNEALECLVNKLKPAHTIALFAYGS